MAKEKPAGEKIVCVNRQARHNYFIDETYEAGLVLVGSEVKSLRDGKANLSDALLIYGMVDELSKDTWFQPFEGGLGIYPPNPRFGPMVHMDTRGEKARWKG